MKLQKITNPSNSDGDDVDCPEYGKLYFVFVFVTFVNYSV